MNQSIQRKEIPIQEMTKLIIQIPCYNEEKTLPTTFADLPKNIVGIDKIEYLIINDGSTDRTVEVAQELGIHHIVSFKKNKGLALAFIAGLDACLHLDADIIVNTDADNQYCGEDIEKLVQPILQGKADLVIGERPIDEIEHFSRRKKKLQHLGSWVVQIASNSKIPDSTSGFRAISREAALRMNVINEHTYTLETIIQAGQSKISMTFVPIRTNPQTRESRLFKSMRSYVNRSATVIIRSFMMYRPLRFFGLFGIFFFSLGIILGIRFLIFYFSGNSSGHVQSLILASILIIIGTFIGIIGLLADLIGANRKILEDIQYRIRKIECSGRYEYRKQDRSNKENDLDDSDF